MSDKSLPGRHTEQLSRGNIELDVRDSVPGWGPYSEPLAPHRDPEQELADGMAAV